MCALIRDARQRTVARVRATSVWSADFPTRVKYIDAQTDESQTSDRDAAQARRVVTM